jgi:hypothetical protein
MRGAVAPWRRAGAWGHWCLPAVARDNEKDEAESVRNSPERERRCDTGGEQWWLELDAIVGEGERELGSEGESTGCYGGGAHPFIEVGGCRGGGNEQ